MENWNGYKVINVNLANHDGFIVCPNVKPNGKWAIKTEYFEGKEGNEERYVKIANEILQANPEIRTSGG